MGDCLRSRLGHRNRYGYVLTPVESLGGLTGPARTRGGHSDSHPAAPSDRTQLTDYRRRSKWQPIGKPLSEA